MKNLLFILSAMMLVSACNGSFSLKGKIENMPEQKYRLEELAFSGNIPVDSGKTNADGSFEINHKANEEALYKLKFVKGKYILLALKNGDKAVISGDWNSLENYKVEGSEGSLAIKGFLVNLRENIKDMSTMKMILDSIKANPETDSLKASAEEDLRNINSRFLEYVKKFADTTKSVSSAIFAANIIEPAMEGPYLTSFYKNLTKRFPGSSSARAFSDNFLNSTPATASEPIGANAGNPAPDFTGETPDGQSLTLSSLRGKYVLLDFWASWCGPCRHENPNVVAAFQQFKDKNFTILGVSLDTDRSKWKAAIEKDGLTWYHVSELKGWGKQSCKKLPDKQDPSEFSDRPEGNIIAANLSGEGLVKKLAEVLK